jgi:hypothetical protein
MAGFAIDLGDEGTAYEQGVRAPSANASAAAAQGMSNLTKGLFGAMDAYSRAQSSGKPTEASLNKAGFSNFVTQLDKLKGVTDPTRLKAGINSAISSYESLGFQVGEGEADAVFRRTGVDISSLTFNPAMAAADAANKQLMQNPSYIYLAEQNLQQQKEKTGQDFTEQDVMTEALNSFKRSEAAAIYLTTKKRVDTVEFFGAWSSHADTTMEDMRGLALAGLRIEMAGGNASPESLQRLVASWEAAKMFLSRPANISVEDFAGIQSQKDALDSVIKTLINYDADMLNLERMAILEPITKSILNKAKEVAKTDILLSKAMLEADYSDYAKQNYPKMLEIQEELKVENTVYTDLYAFAAGEPVEGGVTELHNLDEIEIATDRKPKDRVEAINHALDFKVRLAQPIDVNKPEQRTLFLNGIGQATVNVSTSNQLLSKETLDTLFDNEVFEKLNLVKKLDPDAHSLAIGQLKDALQAQSNLFATTMKGDFETSVFEVTGIGEAKLKAERTTSPSEWAGGLFQDKADKYYGGNIYRMIKDSGRALSTGERTELRGRGWSVEALGRNYSEITRTNNQFKTYANYWRRLGGDPSTMESMILTRQEDDAAPVATNNNLTADQNDAVTATIEADSNLGVPLEDIDFESNAEATPKEPDEEIVVTPLDSEGNPTITLAAPLQSGFDSLTESEGTDIHLDGRNIITLPYGIVPDKNSIKKSDGTAIDPEGTHGLKESDLTDIDYSGATKFGLSRSSYSSDEQFAKAVYVEFGKQAAENYGTGFEDLSDKAKEAAYDIAWNAGVESTGWSSVKTMLDETSKDEATQTTDNLIGFTTNFRSGKEKVNNVSVNNYPRGLLKRRLTTYNLVAKTGEEAVDIVTTSVETNGKRTGTKYDIRKSDGTVLKSWTKPDLNETLGTLSVN